MTKTKFRLVVSSDKYGLISATGTSNGKLIWARWLRKDRTDRILYVKKKNYNVLFVFVRPIPYLDFIQFWATSNFHLKHLKYSNLNNPDLETIELISATTVVIFVCLSLLYQNDEVLTIFTKIRVGIMKNIPISSSGISIQLWPSPDNRTYNKSNYLPKKATELIPTSKQKC